MNLDISKLSIDELKTFKKFNREFLPKIKKLDFNFADMKKGELMLISTPKDIIKLIKKTPSTKKYNFKDIRLKLAKKRKADNKAFNKLSNIINLSNKDKNKFLVFSIIDLDSKKIYTYKGTKIKLNRPLSFKTKDNNIIKINYKSIVSKIW